MLWPYVMLWGLGATTFVFGVAATALARGRGLIGGAALALAGLLMMGGSTALGMQQTARNNGWTGSASATAHP